MLVTYRRSFAFIKNIIILYNSLHVPTIILTRKYTIFHLFIFSLVSRNISSFIVIKFPYMSQELLNTLNAGDTQYERLQCCQ